MSENLMKFLSRASKDRELAEKINKETDINAIIAIAKEMGVELTAADFENDTSEISDDELDAVTGGKAKKDPVNCVCAIGGGGSGDDDDTVCPCVLGGIGYTQVNGHNEERCICAVAGAGIDY